MYTIGTGVLNPRDLPGVANAQTCLESPCVCGLPARRVFPFIQVVRDQTLNMTLANVVKTDMEVRR
jgi:hypothetical protein